MRLLKDYFLALLLIGIASCSNPGNNRDSNDATSASDSLLPSNPKYSTYHVAMTGFDTSQFQQHYKKRIEPPAIDLNQSLENKTISELAVLKNTLLAMKGNIFEDGIYLKYFSSKPWYQPPFWDDHFTIRLNEAEQQFIQRIEAQLGDKKKYNYTDDRMPNSSNVINAFQWDRSSFNNHKALSNHGFFITADTYNQLFKVYEQNLTEQIPPFVTTDLILNQMHLFYGALENEIEATYLQNILIDILDMINIRLYASYEKTLDPKIEQAIEEDLLYFAIPFAILTGEKKNLIGNYHEQYLDELTNVSLAEGNGSSIMKDTLFDYSVFKPYGHYSQNEQIEKFYKALTWLQKIRLCLNDDIDLYKAIIIAYIIHRNPPIRKKYEEYVELKAYFSNQRNQFTLWQFADVLAGIDGINTFDDLFKNETISQIKQKINIKDQEICQYTVGFMPKEHQNLYTDLSVIERELANPAPIGLFAALGNPAALGLLTQKNPSLSTGSNEQFGENVKEKITKLSDQKESRSMDWLTVLLTSLNETSDAEGYMQHQAWQRKELNTMLASWIQLDQRVYLTASAKKTDTKPEIAKSTVLKGYVEPNVKFWESAMILLNHTKGFLSGRNVLSSRFAKSHEKLVVLISFLNTMSQKELNNLPLTASEYKRIAEIGIACHDFALSLINPTYSSKYQKITSDIAFNTRLFTNKDKTYLIGGIGPANPIYVLVHIEDYIYLTRGAVYSYYELPNYSNSIISNGQWRQMLKSDLQPNSMTRDLFDSIQSTVAQEEILASIAN